VAHFTSDLMNQRNDLSHAAQREILEANAGSETATFSALAGACVRQFFAQNGWAPLPEALLSAYTMRMWTIVNDAGRPRPLPDDEPGEPVEMPEGRVADLAGRIMSGLPYPERHLELDTPTRQLLKACLQPEFRQCRESYRKIVDGGCRRQELARGRQRLSGSHCVDCPYWVALRPEQHAALLEKSWMPGSAVTLSQYREIFLPEKFRALRLFLWRAVRHVN
jgi:hypothetical protein